MPGWFKGMEVIIQECGLWPEAGLPAQCQDFKCPINRTDCCCQRVLFTQPDFTAQKSQLQELIESHGHLCNFYGSTQSTTASSISLSNIGVQ